MHAFAHENLFRREKHKACVSFAVVYATQSCPTLSVTAWTVARQAPLSMGFPRQNTGVGCHFHLQGIFLTQGLSGHLPQVSYITGRFLTTEPPGKHKNTGVGSLSLPQQIFLTQESNKD